MNKTDTRERRIRERRRLGRKVRFPFTDSDGCVVPFNRSRQPDRRKSNYGVREMGIKQSPTPQGGPVKK